MNKPTEVRRKTYNAPIIHQVQLDSEISLALQSIPPWGPDEGITKIEQNDYFDDVFKAEIT